jgi:hypothetical protein
MEYIGLNPSEQKFGEKNLLYCEMEVLTTIKRYQLYKKLRKEELALKSLLKKKVNELKDELKSLDHMLPHVKLHKQIEPMRIVDRRTLLKSNKLEEQITDIKNRLAALG